MPRLLRRAAVLGATAHVASSRGEARGEAEAAQPAPPAPVAAAPVVAAPVAAATPADPYAGLIQLKELLDAGVLTQDEFDAQKRKILGS